MQHRVILEGHEFFERIMRAEQACMNEGISIESGGSEGIVIRDLKSGLAVKTINDKDYSFPRSCECNFAIIEQDES